MKGDYDCRCNCCVYWRRHVHRVAGNRDRNARYQEIAKKGFQKKLKASQRRESALLSKQMRLEARVRALTKENNLLLKENGELQANIEALPLHAWIAGKFKKTLRL